MSEKEFKNKIKKVTGDRNHKVKNSLGVYDAYKYYRRNKPKDPKFILTESQYFAIIRLINNTIAQSIIDGHDFTIPFNLGTLEIRKFDRNITFDSNGNIQTNLPIDWDKTLKLWYEDKNSFKQKKLIRVNTMEIFTIYYNRGKANYNNKSFYEFRINRKLKQGLKNRINKGVIDALKLAKNYRYD